MASVYFLIWVFNFEWSEYELQTPLLLSNSMASVTKTVFCEERVNDGLN